GRIDLRAGADREHRIQNEKYPHDFLPIVTSVNRQVKCPGLVAAAKKAKLFRPGLPVDRLQPFGYIFPAPRKTLSGSGGGEVMVDGDPALEMHSLQNLVQARKVDLSRAQILIA